MKRVENWSIQVHLGQYKSPKYAGSTIYLCGNIYGHQLITNGRRIKSSKIIELDINDRIARTADAIYRLGRPDKWYVEWLRRNNFSLKELGLG
jgi:hypothetical protein